MATAPTDEPLPNSDRTVGVRALPLPNYAPNAFKRDALLFHQIVIPGVGFHRISGFDELYWLRDIGIVLDVPLHLFPPRYDYSTLARQQLDVLVAEMGVPIDALEIPDERLGDEVLRLLGDPSNDDIRGAVSLRLTSIVLRFHGFNAFPILETHRQIGNVFRSGTTPVLEVILKSMPIPDDQTAWEDIIEFRNDPEAMKRLRALRVWTRKFAHATTATSLAEMKEEIEVLLDEYEEHMKLHRMKVNKGAAETLLTVAGKLTEDLVKLKWSELAKLPFILRERKISLLEAEAKAPNRELAYVSIARSRFSR